MSGPLRAADPSYTRRLDLAVAGMHASAPRDDTEAIFVASVPLTETGWTQLPRCTLAAFGAGRVLSETGTGD